MTVSLWCIVAHPRTRMTIAAYVPLRGWLNERYPRNTEATMKKAWKSKTLWVAAIAFAAVLAQEVTGEEVIDTGTQAIIISAVAFALRLVTKEQLDWSL